MILGIIPARSGSKSIKDKNIKPLKSLPLMAWSIKAGLACKQIDKIVVSTDSKKYANLAEFYGAEAIIRPENLAKDETPMTAVLQHAVREIEKQGEKVDVIVLLDPTSPFRKISDIEACLEKIKKPNTDSVVTVCKAEHNPYYVMAGIKEEYLQYPLFKIKKEIKRRQDAPIVYRINAGVYVIKKEVLIKDKIFTNKTKVVIMSEEQSAHIDSEVDFKYAEFLLKEGYVKLNF